MKRAIKNKRVLNLAKATALMAFSLCTTGVQAQKAGKSVPIPVIHNEESEGNSQYFYIAEQMPEFVGGQKALFKFLSENLYYTSDSSGIEGTIYVGFIVETDGTLSNISIKRGKACLNEEAVRVVKLMSGKWKCGYQNGKPVRVAYTIPIKIHLE
jgi:periplasmic protein TonB